MGEQGGGRSKWMWGCGIGCLGVIVVGVIALVGLYFFGMSKLGEAQVMIAEELNNQYAVWKAENKVPEEQVALFDELAAAGAEPGASFAKTGICFVVLATTFEDGRVEEDEIAQVQNVMEFLRENPDCSMGDATELLNRYPELQTEIQRLMTEAQTGAAKGAAEPATEESDEGAE